MSQPKRHTKPRCPWTKNEAEVLVPVIKKRKG